MDEPSLPEQIVVRCRHDSDGLSMLFVRAQFAGFDARAEAWIDVLACSTFAERLSEYPLANPATFSTGYGAGPSSGPLELIGFQVSERSGKGQVIVRVHLASEAWEDGTAVIAHEATIQFPTSYEYLRRFSRDLHGVLDGVYADAILSPDILV